MLSRCHSPLETLLEILVGILAADVRPSDRLTPDSTIVEPLFTRGRSEVFYSPPRGGQQQQLTAQHHQEIWKFRTAWKDSDTGNEKSGATVTRILHPSINPLIHHAPSAVSATWNDACDASGLAVTDQSTQSSSGCFLAYWRYHVCAGNWGGGLLSRWLIWTLSRGEMGLMFRTKCRIKGFWIELSSLECRHASCASNRITRSSRCLASDALNVTRYVLLTLDLVFFIDGYTIRRGVALVEVPLHRRLVRERRKACRKWLLCGEPRRTRGLVLWESVAAHAESHLESWSAG